MNRTALTLTLISILLASLFLVASVPSLKATDETLHVEWQQFLPGISGEAVVQTPEGGYLVLGTTASVEGVPPVYENYESVLVGTDESGNTSWTKTYLFKDLSPKLFSIIETSDGGYALGGEMNGNAVLLKIDSQGEIQWRKEFPGHHYEYSNESVFDFGSFIQTSDDGYVFAGSYPYPGPAPPYQGMLLMIKADALGNLQWNRTYASYSGFRPSSIMQTKQDEYVVIGTSSSHSPISPSFFAIIKTDSDGSVQWYKTYGGEDSYFRTACKKGIATNDGGFLLVGSAARYGSDSSGEHGWFVKVDAKGTMLWNKTVESQASQIASVQANKNEYVFAGTITTYVTWIGKLDDSGNWSDEIMIRTEDPYGNISPNSIITASNGSYAFVGKWDITSSGGNSRMWLVKISPSHPPKTAETFPEPWFGLPL
jgi:hypothetical protein